MPTLTSRLHDLVTVIASAFNSRVQAPATGYDVAKLNGYTGTQAQWLADFSDPGNTDYAGQFTAQLTQPLLSGNATEGQVGATQLATQAETFTGTSATKVVSPKNLAAYNQYASGIRVNGIAGLLSLMQGSAAPGAGAIIHVGAENAYFGITTYGSVWRVAPSGKAEPMVGIPILIADSSSMTNLGYNYSNAGGALWNRWLNFDHKNTAVSLGSGAKLEYRWDNNSGTFRLWPGPDTYSQIEYTGGTDQSTSNNGYTVIGYDTVVFDGLGIDYQGTSAGTPKSVYRINHTGRYDLQMKLAFTNDDLGYDYQFTIYNISQNRDHFQSLYRIRADMALNNTAQGRQFNANDTFQTAIFKGSATGQWIRRGNTDNTVFSSNRPMLSVRYVGWS